MSREGTIELSILKRTLVALVVVLLVVVPVLVWLDSAAQAEAGLESRAQDGQARTIHYTYDGAGRLVRADYGDGVTILYTYDAAGNLLRRQVITTTNLYLPVVLKGA
jgi:YD repeat-containing protein